MNKLLLVLAALAVNMAMAMAYDCTNNTYFLAWAERHHKNFTNCTHQSNSFNTFLVHHTSVQAHNALYDAGLVSYTQATNEFSDMTTEEVNGKMKGLLSGSRAERRATGETPARFQRATAPPTRDWRLSNVVSPIQDQGQCGSCWAFATTSAVESNYAIRHNGVLIKNSEQQLVSCDKVDLGCNGGNPDNAFAYLQKAGQKTEASYPYASASGKAPACPTASVLSAKVSSAAKITNSAAYVDVTMNSEAALMNAVGTNGPVVVAIDASHQSFQNYASGVYSEPACSYKNIDHAVVAIGYGHDAVSGKDYWIIRNHWNTNWGMSGYMWLQRNASATYVGGMCGVAHQASYPNV